MACAEYQPEAVPTAAEPVRTPAASHEPPPSGSGEGRLPPEVIQKIVRSHYTVFRRCFEAGLGRDAHLQGRVSIRFVINVRGDVENAEDSESDLPDPQVITCIANEFSRMKFPEPQGGIVTVVYPIMLEPG
jgi:hypothetical protein